MPRNIRTQQETSRDDVEGGPCGVSTKDPAARPSIPTAKTRLRIAGQRIGVSDLYTLVALHQGKTMESTFSYGVAQHDCLPGACVDPPGLRSWLYTLSGLCR